MHLQPVAHFVEGRKEMSEPFFFFFFFSSRSRKNITFHSSIPILNNRVKNNTIVKNYNQSNYLNYYCHSIRLFIV